MEQHFRKYLEILGLDMENPGLEYLKKLVRAHLIRFPFENVSKTYYRKLLGIKGLPDIALHLHGVENFGFGGTCYLLNYYFKCLLTYLGFDVRFCSADMHKPDVHVMNIVTIEGNEYIVDAGYASPLLRPIPRYLSFDFELSRGEQLYRFRPVDSLGRTFVEVYENGELVHGYTAKPEGREIEQFEEKIESSYDENSTFVHSLFLVRHYEDRSVALHNLNLTIHYENNSAHKMIGSEKELLDLLEEEFCFPCDITRKVIKQMSRLQEELLSIC